MSSERHTDCSNFENPGLILGLLVVAASASIMSTDLYAPSLPHLPEYFNTSAELVKLTMSLNLLAYGLAQLFYGPISDRVGRRPVIIAGMLAFSLCALGCAAAQTIEQLILARVLLGLAAASEAVVGYAVLYDVFDKQDRVRAMAIFGIAMSATPALAPLLGGYVHVLFGWRVNFLLVAGLGVIATLLLVTLLPETNRSPSAAIGLKRVLSGYFGLLHNRHFLSYALIAGLALGSIFAFITAGPFIYIDQLGVATERFGIYYGATILGYIVGSLFARQLVGRLSVEVLLGIGLVLSIFGCLAILYLLCFDLLTPLSLTIAVGLVFLGMGPIFAVAPILALEAAGGGAGTAAALLGSIELLTGALAAAAVSVFHDATAWPFAITITAMMCLALLAFRVTRAA